MTLKLHFQKLIFLKQETINKICLNLVNYSMKQLNSEAKPHAILLINLKGNNFNSKYRPFCKLFKPIKQKFLN